MAFTLPVIILLIVSAGASNKEWRPFHREEGETLWSHFRQVTDTMASTSEKCSICRRVDNEWTLLDKLVEMIRSDQLNAGHGSKDYRIKNESNEDEYRKISSYCCKLV